MRGMNRDVRRIDLRLSLALAKHGVIYQALPHLNLNVLVRKPRDIGLRVRSEAKNVGEVELHLGPPACSGGNFVAVDHGLI